MKRKCGFQDGPDWWKVIFWGLMLVVLVGSVVQAGERRATSPSKDVQEMYERAGPGGQIVRIYEPYAIGQKRSCKSQWACEDQIRQTCEANGSTFKGAYLGWSPYVNEYVCVGLCENTVSDANDVEGKKRIESVTRCGKMPWLLVGINDGPDPVGPSGQ